MLAWGLAGYGVWASGEIRQGTGTETGAESKQQEGRAGGLGMWHEGRVNW